MQLLSIIALALPAFVAAQDYGAPPPDPTTTSSSAVPLPTNVHLVMLGQGNAVTFNPNTVTAQVNDTIVFQVSKDSTVQHGVVQSDPNSPCSEIPGGLNTGLMSPGQSFAVIINSTQPITLFCPQVKPVIHCDQMAMVMIINPSSPTAISALEAAATTVTNEATATMPQSSGSGIVETAIPTQISGSSGSSSGSGSSNSAVKGSITIAATFLVAVMGLFVTMA